MTLSLVSTHCLLDCFICREIYCVSRSYAPCQILLHNRLTPGIPAPTITLDIPRHNAPTPSTLDIVAIALDTPVYTAAGVGLTTCMRVYGRISKFFS